MVFQSIKHLAMKVGAVIGGLWLLTEFGQSEAGKNALSSIGGGLKQALTGLLELVLGILR